MLFSHSALAFCGPLGVVLGCQAPERSRQHLVQVLRTPAERMRLFRKRRKFRRRVAKVEVDPAEIDALIQRGYLDPSDRDDLEALGAAVTACFSDALMTP
jgi:hypothetical protein